MPCWTTTMIGIQTGKPLDLDRMNDALIKAGYRVINYHSGDKTIDFYANGKNHTAYADGRIMANSIRDIADVQKAYSAETIRQASKRFGWKAQETKDKAGQLTIKLTR